MSRIVHCTSHCRVCGSHFHSTSAFDMHRQFEEAHKDDWNHRVCVEPADIRTAKGEARLAPLTETGVCDISVPSAPQLGVTVWSEPVDPAAANRLKGLRAA